jgi:NAD-dependent DNA ligase
MRRKKVACELEQPPSAPAPRRRSRSARAVDQLAHLDGWLQLLHGARPLEGKSVALIGTLFGMPIEESLLLLEAMGANVQGRQNLKTDLVILGQASATSSSQPDQPLGVAQLTQATKRQADGQPIKILTQRQLLAWIPGGMDRVRELTGS